VPDTVVEDTLQLFALELNEDIFTLKHRRLFVALARSLVFEGINTMLEIGPYIRLTWFLVKPGNETPA
jgi:hypothetical protein